MVASTLPCGFEMQLRLLLQKPSPPKPCSRRARVHDESNLLQLLLRGGLSHSAWEDPSDRRAPLFLVHRVRQRFAWNHLIPHGRVVDEDRLDGRDLLEVGGLETLN